MDVTRCCHRVNGEVVAAQSFVGQQHVGVAAKAQHVVKQMFDAAGVAVVVLNDVVHLRVGLGNGIAEQALHPLGQLPQVAVERAGRVQSSTHLP